MIKIDKGIDIPKGKSGRKEKYPLNEMEIGDSFFVENAGIDNVLLQRKISAVVSNRSKRMDSGFSVRREEDPLGVRVFRIK